MAAGKRGVFRRAIAIDQPAIGESFDRFFDMRHREDISPSQELPKLLQAVQVFLDHLLKQPGGEPECGDPFAFDCLGQFPKRWHFRWINYEPRAVQQAPPYLKGGSIESNRRELQKHVARADR